MIKIKEARPNDAQEFIAFLKQLDSETSFMLYEPGERKTNEEKMAHRIGETNKNSLLLLAEDEGRIVGFLSAERGSANRIKHSAYIVIGILKNYRGKGIGQKMLEELDRWAMDNWIIRLELTVMKHNENAIKLYEKIGFKIESIREKSCFVNGKFIDEYHMAKVFI